MIIAASVIALLAILLVPILLIRFHTRWVAAFNLAVTNRITSRFAARLPEGAQLRGQKALEGEGACNNDSCDW